MAKKILIVDDEKGILEFLSYNFNKNGWIAFTASNANEAINKAIIILPDAIIADIRMPETDGIEMCRKMKNNDLLKDIPILFLTADSDEYLALSAHIAGGEQYINKPAPVHLLIEIVEEMIEKKK